ncbi:hypothetical protein ACFL5Q_04140 [Planctomycetota bacterium]
MKKDVILCTQTVDDIPFDLRRYNHIVYGGDIVVLREALQKAVLAIIDQD